MSEGNSFIAGLGIGMIIGAIISGLAVTNEYRKSAVEHGLGMYCPDNGNFAWIGGCDAD